jgi:hypothetical protein
MALGRWRSFFMLTATSKLSLVTGPTTTSDAHLRRAKGLALSNGVGLEISRAAVTVGLRDSMCSVACSGHMRSDIKTIKCGQ